MIQNIAELREPPVVGRYYMVPTVWAFEYNRGEPTPIHGTWHEDALHIGFEDHHYHVDLRFVSERLLRWEGGPIGVFKRAIIAVSSTDITLRKMLCKRDFGDMPVTGAGKHPFPKLEKAFADAKPINGNCPHKGYDLRTVRPINGCVRCPLHGLKFREKDVHEQGNQI